MSRVHSNARQPHDLGQPVSTGDLDPDGYPWAAIAFDGVLLAGSFRRSGDLDADLATAGAHPMDRRHAVVAVGSNASAAVMQRKLASAGVSGTLPMTIRSVDGVAVGHSAHISQPGYIAAAPYRCGRCRRAFVTVHPDDDQLDALDATEPNYERVDLGDAWIYASRWQVLAVAGLVVTLRPQRDLHRFLAEADPRFAAAVSGVPVPDVARSLAHDGTGGSWRDHWRRNGFTRHAGFGSRRA